MFEKPIDFKKIHKALRETYKRQMEIKKEFPHRFQSPVWTYDRSQSGQYQKEMEERLPWKSARWEFDDLSIRMTYLCCILNHAKGKLHMRTLSENKGRFYDKDYPVMTLDNQAKFIGDKWEEFAITDSDEEVVEKIVSRARQTRPRRGIVACFTKLLGM